MGEVIKRGQGWSIRWYEGGRRRVLATKQTSYADAKRMLAEIEARVARGEAGIAERRQQVYTLGELVTRFLSEYSRPRIKDLARYRELASANLKRAEALFGKRADHVTSVDVARLREALRRTHAAASARVTLAFLSTTYSWAVREGLIPTNPCRGVERPEAPSSIDFLSREDARRLMETARAWADDGPTERMCYLGIVLALHAGLRKGELLGLRWQDIDLETRRLTIARSYGKAPKSGKPRHLRLPAELVPLLAAWRAQCPGSSGLVLPAGRSATGATREAMLGIRRLWVALGFREVSHPWHVLRHTFASHFVMAGGNILALQKILGHSDLKMTLVYAHLAPDFLDGELERVKY